MAHAAGGAGLDQDEDEECLHCSVCFHKYDDNLKRPKSLPCSHTFCLTCLQTIHSGTTLKCPLCQRQAVGIANVSTLPNNKYVQLIGRLNEKLRDVQIQVENYKEIIENIIETPTTSKKLRVIDWGCLGYYPDNLTKIRLEYFVNVVQSQKPDIVFLSHIGEPVCDYLQQCFPSYIFIYDKMGQTSSRDPTDYATVHCRQQIRILRITMLNTTVSYDSHEIIRPSFPLTEPCERTNTPIYNILKLEVSFGEMKLILLNTHLRNIGRNERELKSIFEEVRKTEKTTNVILGIGGGPSDKEIIDVGGLPSRMVDMQKVCVKISNYEFILNDSKKHCIESITDKKFAYGFRDDRFFLLSASTGKVAVHAGLFRYICIPTPYTTSFDHIVLVHDIMMKETYCIGA